MGESLRHIALVRRLVDWVAAEYYGGSEALILVDVSGRSFDQRPPAIDGFVPDVFAHDPIRSVLVLGEAKSDGDLETQRSRIQLQAFLRHCSVREHSLFVLAVPWYRTRFARAYLKVLARQAGIGNVTAKVLDKLPG